MLQAYSVGIDVAEGNGTASSPAIPFNNVTIQKGCTAVLSAPATIQLNRCGVYYVSCDASAEVSGDVGNISIELVQDGVLQPKAQSTATPASGTAVVPLHFETLVQVAENNTPCACSSPSILQVLNTGEAVTFTNCNVVVTKLA